MILLIKERKCHICGDTWIIKSDGSDGSEVEEIDQVNEYVEHVNRHLGGWL
jgi:hypothetical protein